MVSYISNVIYFSLYYMLLWMWHYLILYVMYAHMVLQGLARSDGEIWWEIWCNEFIGFFEPGRHQQRHQQRHQHKRRVRNLGFEDVQCWRSQLRQLAINPTLQKSHLDPKNGPMLMEIYQFLFPTVPDFFKQTNSKWFFSTSWELAWTFSLVTAGFP